MSGLPARVRLLEGFSDPGMNGPQWNALLGQGSSNTVFLTWQYQKAWWDSFGRGKLLLLAAERGGRTVLIAPLFWDGGMVFLVGSGGSDYLGFVGAAEDAEAMVAVLGAARELSPEFLGFRFYHMPDTSSADSTLHQAARALGMYVCDEGELPAPRLVFDAGSSSAAAVASKKSLVRHENGLRRGGRLEFVHTNSAGETARWLEGFFEQHIGRWSSTPDPSLFRDERQRRFYRTLAAVGAEAGWLRFAALVWEGSPVAFHYGFHYAGEYLWYKPSFEKDLARLSPGEALLRRLLLAAAGEGARVFDFGLGDEPFKRRFCNAIRVVRTWGMYPRGD